MYWTNYCTYNSRYEVDYREDTFERLIAPLFPMIVNVAPFGVLACVASTDLGSAEVPKAPARSILFPSTETYK